jgi:small-conductance mechanosensitive channel
MAVHSVMLSIYWAADVFNLSALCWQIFQKNYIDLENLQVSILKLSMVINLWFIFAYVAKTILSFMRLHYQSQDPTTAASREVMGRNVIQVLVWGVWLLMSLSIMHISVAWLLAISGGLSTGIGFASKDIIENIYYGASLMAGRIKVGDWIEVDGTMGKVSSISYTSTMLESIDGSVIAFQNSQLFTKNYKNMTKTHGYELHLLDVGVAYGTDIDQVRKVLLSALRPLGRRDKFGRRIVDEKYGVKVTLNGFGESSVDLLVKQYVLVEERYNYISSANEIIYNALNKNGIQIPFPQQDVYIKEAPGTTRPE